MVELKLDVSKRFMVLASIVLIFGTVAGVGFAGQNEFNLPLSWILGSDGTSVDVDENDRIDDSDHLEGYTASDLMAGGDSTSGGGVGFDYCLIRSNTIGYSDYTDFANDWERNECKVAEVNLLERFDFDRTYS